MILQSLNLYGLQTSGSPSRGSPTVNQEEDFPFDVECHNEDDIMYLDDFTKGKDEFKQENRVIILREGNSKVGECYGRISLLTALLTARYGGGPRETSKMYMTGPYPKKENRYFKLPLPAVWIDVNGLSNLLKGWKVLRLKEVKVEKIGTHYGISTMEAVSEKIYTLVKVKTKFQGKEEEIPYKINKNLDIELKVTKDSIQILPTTPIDYYAKI